MDNNLDELTLDQLQEKANNNELSFGEMCKVMALCSEAIKINERLDPTKTEAKLEAKLEDTKTQLRQANNALLRIKDILDEYFGFKEDDYE